jgi:small subunit ribosomal protein S14
LIRCNAMDTLRRIDRKGFPVRLRNRCILTNRGRAVYRDYQISRIKLRELTSHGLLTGMRKSS